MSTAVETTQHDPNIGDADDFAKASLDAPEGNFRFHLAGVYGLGQTNNGKHYLNVMYRLDQVAHYDDNGDLVEIEDIDRPHRLFHKFWIESKYGNSQLASWLENTTGIPKGEHDAATNRYVFDKTEALNQSIDEHAWNFIRHKKDETYGWQIDIGRDFRKNAPKRIKPTNGATS